MRLNLRNATAALMAISLLLICNRVGLADGAAAVRVKYDSGDTELVTVGVGIPFSKGSAATWKTFPAELNGMAFTQRIRRQISPLTVDAPKGTTIYFIFGDGPEAAADSAACRAVGCELVGPARLSGGNGLLVFKLVADGATHLTIDSSRRGIYGVLAAAEKLSLDASDNNNSDKKPDAPVDTMPATTLHIDSSPDTTPIPGPSTRPAQAQVSITALEVDVEAHGMMLGQTTEETLTLTGSTTPQPVAVRFVTKVGDEMCLARDEAVRYIHLKYPNWYAGKAEITFEDKYIAHDGGSGGTAVGTMILSCIQGFAIDPDVAITGDISANGKVRAIGGVSAKIKGAIASKCSLVAIPAENADQLVDAVVYGGPELVSDIQVIGIANLDDAVATVRSDRTPELTQAIALFAEVQKSLKDKPSAVKDLEIQEKLHKVLYLAPQHLSAQVLLSIAENKEPKTLSATASEYYTFLAAGNMTDALKQRSDSDATASVPSSVVRTGLANLRKLRPLADPNVRPLIDAWSRFIGAWNEMQEGFGSPRSVEEQRQSLLDEMAKENANEDLMQKMLKEGM
jgi:hypothetical protein